MTERTIDEDKGLLRAVLLGGSSFLLSGLISSLIIMFRWNYIIATLAAGIFGCLIFGLFYKRDGLLKKKVIAGLIGVPAGTLGSIVLIEGLGALIISLLPSSEAFFESSPIGDILAVVLAGVGFGLIYAACVYGKKALSLFALTCGLFAIPAALIVTNLNRLRMSTPFEGSTLGAFAQFDLNFLTIMIALGLGIGLGQGLFLKRNQTETLELMTE